MKKKGANPSYRFREKRKNAHFNPAKITSPIRRLCYSNNQL